MSRRTLGILASLVGSAIGAWWVMTQRRPQITRGRPLRRDRGRTIFENTPTPANTDAVP